MHHHDQLIAASLLQQRRLHRLWSQRRVRLVVREWLRSILPPHCDLSLRACRDARFQLACVAQHRSRRGGRTGG